MWVRDEGTQQRRLTVPSLRSLGYEVRGGLGGQEGLKMARKWVQQRGQIPAHKELRRAESPNIQAREEAEAPSRRELSLFSSSC